METKKPRLEEVKKRYLNAKKVKCLSSEDIIDIENIITKQEHFFNGSIWIDVDENICDNGSVCLWKNGSYAEIISYKEEIKTPKHYDNSKGTLYKVATERGWNPYLFDIVKRLERAEKKGEFKTDLEKSINVIKLWLKEYEEIKN